MSKEKAKARIEILRALLNQDNNTLKDDVALIAAIVADSAKSEAEVKILTNMINRLKDAN